MTNRRKRRRDRRDRKNEGDIELKWIRVDKIIVPERYDLVFDDNDEEAVVASAKVIGLINPIAVRRVEVDDGLRTRTKIELVAGKIRLLVAQILGQKRILCRFVVGDDDFVERVRIAENLCRRHLSVLEQSKLLVRWDELNRLDSDQVDQKSMRGRRRGGEAEAARKLPIEGTEHAKRQQLRRAKQVARIHVDAQPAIYKGGLANNQSALLDIAKAKGLEAQLRKVALMVSSQGGIEERGGEDASKPVPAQVRNSRRKIKRKDIKHSKRVGVVSFEELEAAWRKVLHERWKDAPPEEREKFFVLLRRTRCRALPAITTFIKQVFQGRKIVYAEHIYRLGKERGLSNSRLRRSLNQSGYRRGRDPRGTRPRRWFFRNRNPDYKNELPAVAEHELKGEPRKSSADRDSDPYYKDLS